MKIQIRGWKRDHGSKEIVSGDLSEAVPEDDELTTYAQDKLYVRRLNARVSLNPETRIEERVRISASASVTLNGRYQVQSYFTKSEIDQMFAMVHANDSWPEVIEALHRQRKVLAEE
ncbi:MAG: hypothetical protein WCE79_26070 [Xanthobacteraceae bacterium]